MFHRKWQIIRYIERHEKQLQTHNGIVWKIYHTHTAASQLCIRIHSQLNNAHSHMVVCVDTEMAWIRINECIVCMWTGEKQRMDERKRRSVVPQHRWEREKLRKVDSPININENKDECLVFVLVDVTAGLPLKRIQHLSIIAKTMMINWTSFS